MEIDTNCFLKFFKKGGGSKEPGHAPILPRFSPPARHSQFAPDARAMRHKPLCHSRFQRVACAQALLFGRAKRAARERGVNGEGPRLLCMASNPGQNLPVVSSQIHAVASSSNLANSSSQLVLSTSYLVESPSHLVVSSILLTSPLLVYSSVILQLILSPFNSSCRTSTRRVDLSE